MWCIIILLRDNRLFVTSVMTSLRFYYFTLHVCSTSQSGALLHALRSSALLVRPVLVNAPLLRVRSASRSTERNLLLVSVLERASSKRALNRATESLHLQAIISNRNYSASS